MSKINPNDRFPPSNLPTNATPWGRTVQDRLNNVERQTVANMQSLAGMNRLFAAQIENISGQLNAIAEQQLINSERVQVYSFIYDVPDGSYFGDIYTDRSGGTSAFFRVGAPGYVDPPAWASGAIVFATSSVNAQAIFKTDAPSTTLNLFTTPAVNYPAVGWSWTEELRPTEVATLESQSGALWVIPSRSGSRTFSAGVTSLSFCPTLTWSLVSPSDPDELELTFTGDTGSTQFITTATVTWF